MDILQRVTEWHNDDWGDFKKAYDESMNYCSRLAKEIEKADKFLVSHSLTGGMKFSFVNMTSVLTECAQ